MNITINKLTYTVEEMGEAVGVSRKVAYQLANRNDFPKIRIGKRIVIPIDSLNRWLENQSASV